MALHEHMLRLLRSFLLSSSLLLGVLLVSGQAQITTTITPDRTLGTAVTQRGTLYNITGGTRPGNGPNLFHSFDRFTVGTNATASFSGPTGVVNILSRVTGGQQSLIDGRLQSTSPGANLYLLNPSGVVFGPRASLDIKGSFHVSTADFLRFADGATFSAHVGQNSTLTVAPPSAFGFLGPTPARIDILGSTLEASAGQTLSVVGGDLGITPFFSIPTLRAPGGRLHLVSVASSGEVGFDPTGQDSALQVTSFARLGEMNLQATRLDVSSDGGGTIVIRGGQLTVANTLITAVTGDRDGIKMGIDLRLAEDVVVDNSLIVAGSFGRGNVGEIRAEAGTLTLRTGAVIGSIARGSGKGGDITVSAREAISISGSNAQGLASGIGTFAAAEPGRLSLSAPSVTIDSAVIGTPSLAAGGFIGGRAGDIFVKADNLTISGVGGIGSGTATDSDGGSITIETGQLTVRGGAQISASSGFRDPATGTLIAGRGAAGNVTITVSEAASLSGRGNGLSSHAQSGSGNAGDIEVQVGRLTISDGAQITSSTLGPGAGGSVKVMATDTVTLAGVTPTGRISGIAVTTEGAGAAGSIMVSAPRILVSDGAQINSSTAGPGGGGSVTVTASDTVTLAGTTSTGAFGSGILANTQGAMVGAGAAGSIMVSAPHILVRDGGQILSSTFGPGAGGSVLVTASDTLTLAGTIPTGSFASGILATTEGAAGAAGAAGSIMVSAPHILVRDGAQINGSTFGPGLGGSVTVTATDTVTLSGTSPTGLFSGILANAQGTEVGAGTAGSVMVTAPRVLVSDGAAISSSTRGLGSGGSVTVTATDTLTLRGTASTGRASGILATTEGLEVGAGTAGSVMVTAPRVLVSDGAAISSSTRGPGSGGSVTVTATDTLTLSGTTPTGAFASGIFATTDGTAIGAGAAGSIVVTAPHITVTDGAGINSSTFGPGAGGSVLVTATDTLTLSGTTSTGAFVSGIFANAQGTEVGAGAAGSVVVTAPHITVTDGAAISSSTFGPGLGGSVTVSATDTVTLSGTSPTGPFSGILANAQGTEVGAGTAGSVMVSAPRILVSGGAQISSSTRGPGSGGSVTVAASDTVSLSGTAPTGRSSGILATTEGTEVGAGAAGSIMVSAPRILVSDGAAISSSTLGLGGGGSVTVTATDTLTLAGTTPTGTFASGIFATTDGTAIGAGAAGSIEVTAPHITVTGGAAINSSTAGPGAGGSVVVTATDTLTLAGTTPTGAFVSGIFATAQGTEVGVGAAGSIEVTAPHITVTGGAAINSSTAGPGAGGSVVVTATDTLTLAGTTPTGAFVSGIFATAQGTEVGAGAAGSIVVTAPRVTVTDGAAINSSTAGPGAGGSVLVTASDTLTLSGTTPTGAFVSGIFAAAQGTEVEAGAAGSVVVTAPRIIVTDGAGISSSTAGPGAGGSVTVRATDTVSLSGAAILSNAFGRGEQAGNAGRIFLSTPVLTMDNQALIETRTFGNGGAGDVEIVVGRMTLTGAAQIGSTSGLITSDRVITAGIGKGGTVTITATDAITITGRDLAQELSSGVFTQTIGTGDAGLVVVSTPQLTIADGAQIGVETSGDGRGGDITVRTGHLSLTGGAQIRSGSGLTTLGTLFIGTGAGGTVNVTATDTIDIVGQESGLSASTAGQGRGGDVLLQARQVRLTNGATISAESTGLGNAGNVTIATSDTFLSTNGSVVTRATQADGGNVQITAPTLVRLRNSAITAEVGGGSQTVGGNITIDPQFVLLQNSQIVANAFEGQGGNIRIQAQRAFLADPASIVSASSALGINGIVNIQAPVNSISGAIAPLPQEFAPITELLRDRCVGRLREGRVSRFLIGGRDGIPSEPGSLLLSPLMQTDPREHGEQSGTPARTGPGQEQAWHAQAGTLEGLDAECAKWMGQKGPTVGKKR